jgi:hypothetical protein
LRISPKASSGSSSSGGSAGSIGAEGDEVKASSSAAAPHSAQH